MKIFNVSQIKQWEAYTLASEGSSSLGLMDRAGDVFVRTFLANSQPRTNQSVHIFCGQGNNGGDGVVIARLLSDLQVKNITVYLIKCPEKPTSEFRENFLKLPTHLAENYIVIDDSSKIPVLSKDDILIDAIFGVGFRGPAQGLIAEIIDKINKSAAEIWSVDIPSGMSADIATNWESVKAHHTITFELPKLSFFFKENLSRIGKLEIVSLGLSERFYQATSSEFHFTTNHDAKLLLKGRNAESSKSDFGHAMIIAGSYGKVGAAVLSTRACLRAGSGLVTAYVPSCAYDILQISAPEAMVLTDSDEKKVTEKPKLDRFDAIGIGPGIGTSSETSEVLKAILSEHKNLPIVLDADALNLLSRDKELLQKLPPNCILTPHEGEFERLFGKCVDSFQRINLQRQKAQEYKVVIILKGAKTSIAFPDGSIHFNTSGNPGMATGGSGDVLTGILTGLLAQKYEVTISAILGTYLHGLAGDFSKEVNGEEALIAGDLVSNLGRAFQSLRTMS